MSVSTPSSPQPLRLAFAVGGVGMGNATRVGAIFEHLGEAEIQLLAFGNSLRWLGPRAHKVTPLRPLSLGTSALHDLFLLPWNLLSWARNLARIARTLRRDRPDVLIVDSEYSAWIIAKILGIPVVGLNHAAAVIALWPRFGRPELRWSYWSREIPDAWLCRLFTATLVPTFVDDIELPERHIAFDALTRELPAWQGDASALLLLRGGSEHLSPVQLPMDCAVEEVGGARPVEDALRRMAQAPGIVCQGGMSSLSEVINMGAPAVCVPLPGHAEQYLMSHWADANGLVTTKANGIVHHEDFPQARPPRPSSASAVAQWLLNFAERQRSS